MRLETMRTNVDYDPFPVTAPCSVVKFGQCDESLAAATDLDHDSGNEHIDDSHNNGRNKRGEERLCFGMSVEPACQCRDARGQIVDGNETNKGTHGDDPDNGSSPYNSMNKESTEDVTAKVCLNQLVPIQVTHVWRHSHATCQASSSDPVKLPLSHTSIAGLFEGYESRITCSIRIWPSSQVINE